MLPTADEAFGAPPPPTADQAFGPVAAPPKAALAASPWSLDLVQQHAGPGQITSAGRSAAKNAAVGGSATSSHLTDQAFDFVPKDGNTKRAALALSQAGVPYDQILDEGDHVHIGWGPKMRGDYHPRKGALPSALEAFGAPVTDIGSRISRRGVEGVEQMAQGGDDVMSGLGADGDRMDALTGALNVVGGGFKALVSPISGAVESALGRPVEAAVGRDNMRAEGIGDVSDGMLGLVAGPKAARVRPRAGVAPLIEGTAKLVGEAAKLVGEAAIPTAEEAFPAIAAAKARMALPSAEDAFSPKTLAAKVEDPMDDIVFVQGKGRTLKLPAVAAEPVRAGLKGGAMDAARSVQQIMAPATIGLGRNAAGILRRTSAQADLETSRAAKQLVGSAAYVGELPVPEQRALVGYIENRSSGATLADPKLAKTADDIRGVMEGYRQRIGDSLELGEDATFIRDYYTHMWKETPQVVEGRMAMGRQGSGRNLKARSIPTLQEGIDAGLTPVTENPIEATMMYASNMSRYLATVDAQAEMTGAGLARFHAPGTQPAGWERLNGIRTDKPGRVIVKDGETQASMPPQFLYAPPDAARVYNNWISNGFDRGDTKGLFGPARAVTNGMTQLKLGLSAFHAVTMAQEAMVSDMARGVQSLSRAPALAARGRVRDAVGELGGAVGSVLGAPTAPIRNAMRGGRMQRELLAGDGVSPASKVGRFLGTPDKPVDFMSATINDAYIRAGGRVRMDPLLRTRGAGSFYNDIANGTWKRELRDAGQAIYGKDRLVLERAKGVLDLAANAIQTTAAPLFESYIPRAKQGAFAANMEDWLRLHPGAGQSEIDQAAHLINRSIDNRFGEMAWDNLFWKRNLKQASQIMLLSPTWTLGTINEIGGGLLDLLGPSAKGLVSGEGLTTRTAYIAALAAQVAMMNGIATYLKTRTAPQGMDFAAYRTGGKVPVAKVPTDERAITPGYQKDVYSFAYDFPNHIGQGVANKLNPALKTALETAANRDWQNDPIRNTNAPPAEQAGQYGDYLLEQFMPISLGQMTKADKRGSNISTGEKALAIREAPSYLEAPDRMKQLSKRREQKAWDFKQYKARVDANRREAR